MKNYNFFDIIGPIMIGPSSSHTAGAARLAFAAKQIAKPGFNKVYYYLSGSFGQTYKGHGTDKALLAGSLGFKPWDERIRSSFSLAKEKGLHYEFISTDEETTHANTARIVMSYPNGNITEIIGASIGGGNFIITKIDGTDVEYTGYYPTLIITYPDMKNVIARVTAILSSADANIANIRTSQSASSYVTLLIELDDPLHKSYVDKISALDGLESVKYIERLE